MMHTTINCLGVFIAAIVSGATGLAFPLIATQCASLLVLLYNGTFDPTVWQALEMYLVPLVAGIFVGTLGFRMFSSEAYARAVSAWS